jgi:hypothetical protein
MKLAVWLLLTGTEKVLDSLADTFQVCSLYLHRHKPSMYRRIFP